MTGFGSAEGNVAGGRLRVEIRTVNHRFFSSQLKLPSELAALEGELRERLRELLGRGHVTATLRWIQPPAGAARAVLTINVERAREVVSALRELKKALRLKGEPSLDFVARHPDVLIARDGGESPVGWAEVQPVVEAAAREVLAMRAREGEALAADLRARLDALEALGNQIAARAPERLQAEHARLKRAVAELTGGVRLDEQRLAQEIALLADRLDVSEELVRFRSHLAACREALAGTGPVGKQLGFLAQELLREVNTVGSKAGDAAIAQAVVAMKGELEKFREQLENIE
ncbi:MAG TPA: YicC/YloC family endoribonuclease [Gemmatimonadales bacterium]|nr:YicC/YloC family endoribonuclease [Gemmatimonadales bacterium]